MRGSRKSIPFVAIVLIAGAVGCTPAFAPGSQIGITPQGNLMVTPSCLVYGDGLMAMGMSASQRFWGRQEQVRALQSRFSLMASDIRVQMAGWKQAARGC